MERKKNKSIVAELRPPKPDGADEYLHGLWRKIGRNGKLYYWDGEWKASSADIKEMRHTDQKVSKAVDRADAQKERRKKLKWTLYQD